MKGLSFEGRIILLGYGTIGQCLLPMLVDQLDLPLTRITVVEADDNSALIARYRQAGLHYFSRRLTRQNLAEIMKELAGPGDLLLNLSVGVDSLTLSDWCHGNGVIYIDTAIEPWEDHAWNGNRPASERTEYSFHQKARLQADSRWQSDGPTAIFTHGANPGLVSHFAKAALIDLAEALDLNVPAPSTQEDWADLARMTGTKVIHISERDTQQSTLPRDPGEFVNTWSIEGFIEEAVMPVEIGWGTHEKELPTGAQMHEAGPRNAIYLERPAAEVRLRSWVPLGGQILGYALPHSESVTISEYLTLYDGEEVSYRPTVAFSYLPCDDAAASLNESMMRDWAPHERVRIMSDDIAFGRDELGVLLLGNEKHGWWYGSQLDIEEARRLVPDSNPTAIQVAAGALAAALWALANPTRSYQEPEDLPHEEILSIAQPFIEPIVSLPTDWTPLKERSGLFADRDLDRTDPWQFRNFVLA